MRLLAGILLLGLSVLVLRSDSRHGDVGPGMIFAALASVGVMLIWTAIT